MMTEIGDTVKVGVVFDESGKIIPKWFVWNGRRYDITRTTFVWKVQEGRSVIHHFAVTDGDNMYELCYNTAELSWRLMNVSSMTG